MKQDQYKIPEHLVKSLSKKYPSAFWLNFSPSNGANSVKENHSTVPKLSDPKYWLRFEEDTPNAELLKSYQSKITTRIRKERILPPIKHWTSQCFIG
jgi:hypothetical protein